MKSAYERRREHSRNKLSKFLRNVNKKKPATRKKPATKKPQPPAG